MKTTELIFNLIKKEIEKRETRSAWSHGVTEYAMELLESLETSIEGGYFNIEDLDEFTKIKTALLNGAENWNQYSWGGSSLIYDGDIARRLCADWELKKTRNGEKKPNQSEEWLDTQARALYQAEMRVIRSIKAVIKEGTQYA